MRVKIAILLLFLSILSCQSQTEDSHRKPGQPSLQKMESGMQAPDDFIVGGRPVREDEEAKSTTVAIYNLEAGSLCSASIIAEDILITAAHCLSGRAEQIKIAFDLRVSSSNLKPISTYVSYPLWRAGSLVERNAGDIALIRFPGGLPNGYKVAQMTSVNHRHKVHDDVVLAGYGINRDSSPGGAGRLRMVEVKIKDPQFSDTEVLIDQSQGKGACHGDSGGPSFTKITKNTSGKSGKLLLWGVTSRGYGTSISDCDGYSVYTKISSYSRWIKDTIEQLRQP